MYKKIGRIQSPDRKLGKSQISRVNNAQGRLMESMIMGGAREYEMTGRARIIKVPEPFRVLKNTDRGRGIATVRFTAKAEPDFVGCTCNGQMIAFESKYTSKDRIRQDVVTEAQAKALQVYTMLGASTYVCCGIGTGFDLQYFMVPWRIWINMDTRYGRKYLTRDDIKICRVHSDTVIHFLDYLRD